MSTLSANTLFHFTRTRETLINILKTRFYPRLSLEENFFFNIFPFIVIPPFLIASQS